MSNAPEKKINKLSKTRIWPSVVFLVLSIMIAVTSFLGFVITSTSIIIQERFDSACTDALDICKLLDGTEGKEKVLLEGVENSGIFSKHIFIFDKDENVIASIGEPTYEKIRVEAPGSEALKNENYTLYYDTSLGAENLFVINENGECEPDVRRLKSPDSISKIVNARGDDSEAIFKAGFWLEKELSGGRTALVKCTPELRFGDFSRSLWMGIIALGAMFVPLIFFFVNVMISINNQKRITDILYTDTVTDGRSFVYYEHAAGEELASRASLGKIFMIVDVTIMKYRSFCNFHGIRAGETLLADVDSELSGVMENGEFCAHSGKSSFVLFMKCADRESGKERIDTIINSLDDMFGHGTVSFHAGIYFSEADKSGEREYTDPADCFNCACAARAAVADENVTAFAVYDDKLLEEQKWTHKVEHNMETALKNEEFKVYLQPKYDPAANKLVGAEALVRWINEEDGFVSPGRFIPIFEKNGFITKLDDYMLSNVAKLQAEWKTEGKEVVPVSVNISRAHFSNPDLAKHICDIVDKYKVPHELIEIELTESAFFDDKGMLLKTVKELRSLGFEISMDDFGAGYSSLNSLKDLPLDVLKLDAEFFRGENTEDRGEIVVSEAISLAKKLNMRIVAEGVEKKEQVDFLADQGCDMIQGFYFSKPMPADEFEEKLSVIK